MADTVRAELAGRLNVSPGALRLVAQAPVRWSDSSLGCPKRGTLYLQVITPGWRLRFEGPGGTPYEVHTNRDGSVWALCSPAHPGDREPGTGDREQ